MKTHEILFQTLSQADDYVNGEQLAKELGVSRTSIWKAIQRLEKDGVVIESLKRRVIDWSQAIFCFLKSSQTIPS